MHEYQWLIGSLAGASVLMFLGTLILVPLLIVRIRPDYFSNPIRKKPWRRRHPIVTLLAFIFKNAIGAVFVLTGILMLLTPGQGVLTILLGLTLMNYPGKYRAERWLITRHSIWHFTNWLRHKAGVAALIEPQAAPATQPKQREQERQP